MSHVPCSVQTPVISILLCARNEEHYLSRTLETLQNQDFRHPYELIIVDNQSTDSTRTIAQTYTPHVYTCDHKGKVPSLRVGVSFCSAPIVAIADADTAYPTDWLAKIYETFVLSPDCQLIFGSSRPEIRRPWLRSLVSLGASLFFRLSLRLGIACSLGFNMALRKQALSDVLHFFRPVALSGWAIGTQVLRIHGRHKVRYSPNLQVPKCMRRYESGGYVATSKIWVQEWIRLLARQPLRITEEEYYRDNEINDATQELSPPTTTAKPGMPERGATAEQRTGAGETLLTQDKLADIVFGEYSLIKGEIQTYIKLFHGQVNWVTAYLAIITSVLAYAGASFVNVEKLPKYLLEIHFMPWPLTGYQASLIQAIGFAIYILVALVGLLFVSAAISYIYIIEVLAARAGVVEDHLNSLAGRKLMAWELEISPRLIRGFVRKGAWVSPSSVRIAWSFGTLLIILFMECLTAPLVLGKPLGLMFLVAVGLAALFQVIQLIEYRRSGVPFVNTTVVDLSDGKG